MGTKLPRNILLLFIINFQVFNCVPYHGYNNYQPLEHIDSNSEHGIILRFPKYSIKVFSERKEDNPPISNKYHRDYDRYIPYPSDTYTYRDVQPIQPHPPIYYPRKHIKKIQYYPVAQKFPLIHREPITDPFCGTPKLNSQKPYDPILGSPKSAHKQSQTWSYGGPNWQTSTQNILRSEPPTSLQEDADQNVEESSKIAEKENDSIINNSEPRSSTDPRFIHSSSKFIKVHKPFGSKVIISKEKVIGHHGGFSHGHQEGFSNGHQGGFNHGQHGGFSHGHSSHFGGHGGHLHHLDHLDDFGETSIHNVNKNTNINILSRNAENEENLEAIDDNKRAAKDLYYERIVGSHLFAAPRWRRNTLSRKKRGVIDAVKLVTDHRARIDMPKTAENIGTATRDLFEEDYSPVYHLRNALASAHDVIYTMLNVRPNGILIPCRYKIIDGNEVSPIVGSINPELFRQHGLIPPVGSITASPTSDDKYTPDQTIFTNSDPIHKMGEILRESVKWAHISAEHAADAIHSARKAVVTARKHWPKMFVPYVRAVEIVQPRAGQEEDIVGSAKDPEFVGVGKMMDYLGMTDNKPDLFPRLESSQFGGLQAGDHILYPHRQREEEIILQKVKESLGSTTYHQLMSQIKKDLATVPPKKEMVGAPRLTTENIKAKLALDRLRNSIKLQKAKTDLKLRSKLPIVKKPIIPKLPTIIKPVLFKHPLLRLEPPKTSAIKPPALKLNPILKSVNPLEAKGPPHPKEISNPIEELKYKINEHLKIGSNATTNIEENEKNIKKHLDKLKIKLYEKYNIQTRGLEHSDILGLAIEQAQKKNPNLLIEDVGAILDDRSKETVASIPNPMFTKEMETPFMGLATKEEMDKYFQQMYASNNDKKNK